MLALFDIVCKRFHGGKMHGCKNLPVVQSPTLDCLNSEYSSSLSSLLASGSCLTRSAAWSKTSLRPIMELEIEACVGEEDELLQRVSGVQTEDW